jgi:PKD repeat protein
MDSYQWNFGDNRQLGPGDRVPNPSHLYPDSGAYKVKLTVTSKCGGSKTCTGSVEVKPRPDCTRSAPDSVLPGSWRNSDSSQTSDQPVQEDTVQLNGSGLDGYLQDYGDGRADSPEEKVRIYPG